MVLAVVKLDGVFYAFQEFCTHRFGPLSEGSFDGFDVQCPWHNSCFDVRTGKVTNGPAQSRFENVQGRGDRKICVAVERPTEKSS
jgi:nitrite reductase/ring-hydroxylating ferredoxin subunit